MPRTPVDTHPLTLALLLADARLPAGGHAYSAGLEPALHAGLGIREVPALITTRLLTVGLVDAGTAIAAAAVAHAGGGAGPGPAGASGTGDRIRSVDAQWCARTPSPSSRAISRSLGRGLLRLAGSLFPDHAAIAACRARTSDERPLCRPVVLGVVATIAGLSFADTARLVFYDEAQAMAAAMLKLEPADPARSARWVLDACAAAESRIGELDVCTDPALIPAPATPQMDEWSETHSRTRERLFNG
ncbi:urease accessory protein UreF [Microbacterium sp. 18062]|uniref:urease accessory protein UreF n=1 Tax=Microbacterium sp. 18062 TaxID=2681410 RepID=UPI00135B0E4F|nr:urease accessory UreF family protein [Microbacterium sp. 18062]